MAGAAEEAGAAGDHAGSVQAVDRRDAAGGLGRAAQAAAHGERIFERLLDEHGANEISYQMVRGYVAGRREEIRVQAGRGVVEAFVPQTHKPGAEAEVDFGDVTVRLGGEVMTCYLFAFRLSYSGKAVRREQGTEANTLVICGAVVTPSLKGRGLAGETLKALRQTAEEAGLVQVIAPVRPTMKAQYPLTPIETFMRWSREDGMALDPWIRTHQRLGAEILAAAPTSQTMTGTVAEWEQWTGMTFPESGDYVIPGGLSLLRVDRSADHGVYREPNIWMRHS
ncbi:hypothetical protein ACIBBE_46125 [Streptomyces sp. NPDC051644]|uniref:hypothetical protein n=1 Tax=Streptomyces sp. NPDC051644 TaxID=3365666 RepID=UPI0037B3FFB6